MNPQTRRYLTMAVIVGGLALLVYVVWKTWPHTNHPESRLALLRLKNIALGRMENGDYDAAIPELQRIVREQPDDPLGHRDLALALFAPDDNGQSKRSGAPEEALGLLAVTQRMLKAEPESPQAHLLAGRIYRERADKNRGRPEELKKHLQLAREQFRLAAELAPNDPAAPYDLYRLETDFVNPDELSKEGMEALTTAARRAPNNLAAQLDLAYRQAAAEQPAVRGTLEKVLNLLPPEAAAARSELEGALEILKKDGDRVAPEVTQRINFARNRLLTETTFQEGLRDLVPHPMAFVLEDFRPAFYAGLPPEAEGKIAVSFERTVLPGAKIAAVSIKAAAHEDLTGAGQYATVLLHPEREATRITTLDSAGQEPLAAVEAPGMYNHAVLADLDLDITPVKDANLPADLDLILYGPSGIRILEQRAADAKRAWIDRTADAKLPGGKDVVWLTVCDFDHDGNLDLVVGTASGTQLLRNTGDWVFDDVTDRSEGIKDLLTTSAVAGDFDRDGDLDLYLITAGGELIFMENLRGGRFSPNKLACPVEKPGCLLALDANNDGRLDLLIGHAQGATLLLADDKNLPHDSEQKLSLTAPHQGLQAGTIDYDNDGRLDVWLLTDDAQRPLRLFRNREGRTFEDVTVLLPALNDAIQSISVADVDDDGDLDLLLAGPSQVTVLRNEGGNQNRWLRVRLRALLIKDASGKGQAAKVNYYGVGSTLEVKAGRHYQLQPVAGTATHFGLGPHKQAEVARIVWTNGVPQVMIRPKLNQVIIEDQRPKGSCPFLYTWDGERFVFVTDCLWSSALGMKLAHGVDMEHQRQHNFLIIPEEKLQPRNGRYVVQFTNELWEVPYLDQVQLWAIEHPAGVEVFSNQRIPPGPKEAFTLIPVRQRRLPASARDHRGRDVLSALQRQDGVFLGGFQRRRYVGLAEPHWLELDLGNLQAAKQATLFLTGWIWPTDTTGNVAISQDPRFRGPSGVVGGVQPPSLLVPDGMGGWTTALPMMGFPCGKMQTVAVDLPLERFPPGDYRVRIATSMELYWDEVFFSVDEPLAALQVQHWTPATADLHDRGYSRAYQESPDGPQLFDYDDVDPTPIWPPRPGPYTRYGDVTSLLHHADTQYVVMSPGDELTLEFRTLPLPPAGQRRTFLFYANGWLKDFDMNGASSEAADPLPFDGMTKYPYDPTERFARTPELERFLKAYLTRQPDDRFWKLLR